MDNLWDCEDIAEFWYRMLKARDSMFYFHPVNRFLNYMELHCFNLQTKNRSWEVAKKHYNLGSDLFESFLDPYMQYSCGYWKTADNLNQAQLDKIELIAQKLKLEPGMRILDAGCGWVGLSRYLAENYGVECVGITVSEEGANYATEKCKGLKASFTLMDYRDMNEQFDRVVCVGIMEHVGYHNYRDFFKMAHRCLKPNGIFLCHTIGNNHIDQPGNEPFTNKYIFPNGNLAYYADITKFTEGLFVLEDWHNFGHHYSLTMDAWLQNFQDSWPKLKDKYGERFYRMWSYYFGFFSGAFRSRNFQLWQIVFTKELPGGYQSVR